MNWKDHCPIDEDEWPVQRQAWRSGWEYRMEHGGGLTAEEAEPIVRNAVEEYSPTILSVWLQGYSTAESVAAGDG